MLKVILSFTLVLGSLAPCAFAQQRIHEPVDLRQETNVQATMTEQIAYAATKNQTSTGYIFFCLVQDGLEPANEANEVEESGTTVPTKKSPGTAFLLSFLFPGLGQHYNGQYVKGAIQEGVFATGVILTATLGKKEEKTYHPAYGEYTYEKVNTDWLYVGAGIAIFSYLWSAIDAPLSASNINQKLKDQGYGHLLQLGKYGYLLSLDAGRVGRGAGAILGLHF